MRPARGAPATRRSRISHPPGRNAGGGLPPARRAYGAARLSPRRSGPTLRHLGDAAGEAPAQMSNLSMRAGDRRQWVLAADEPRDLGVEFRLVCPLVRQNPLQIDVERHQLTAHRGGRHRPSPADRPAPACGRAPSQTAMLGDQLADPRLRQRRRRDVRRRQARVARSGLPRRRSAPAASPPRPAAG